MEEDPSKIPEIPGKDHAEFRETFVSAHPDVILTYMREPHRKFVERIYRDYMVHGSVSYYEVAEMRTRSDRLVQTTGFSKTSEDLLKVVQSDNKAAIAAESDVLDRLRAFFVALEYLNICDFTFAAGPLRYLSELEEWRHENRGLSLLLSVDNLIRKKVVKLNSDKRKFFPTFSDALLEVLKNHKQLWNDARSSAEVEKFQQAQASAPQTPAKRGRSPEASTPPPPNRPPGSRARKNKLRRERQKEMVKKYKEGSKSDKPADKNTKVPDKEWKTITSFKYNGRRPWHGNH